MITFFYVILFTLGKSVISTFNSFQLLAHIRQWGGRKFAPTLKKRLSHKVKNIVSERSEESP